MNDTPHSSLTFGLDGKTALLTGSTSGLGLACARALAEAGAKVVINGRDPGRLARAFEQLQGTGHTAVQADATTTEGRAKLLDACPAPDILVNNLSGPPPRSFFDATDDDWDSVLNATLRTPLSLIRSVAPGMAQRKFGRIVNVTSAMVLTPRPHHVLSTTARTGLTAAVKAISFDLVANNVTINNLLPERIDTPRQEQMARAAMQREGISYEDARKAQLKSIAAGRLGRPEEFAAACVFLCSAKAGYISGQNLKLDGGSSPCTF